MDTGKLSVIVPCYNIEAFIEKTVQSILAQTYSNLEVILVDDGSTDGTSAIIDRIEQENACIRAFHKENGGVSSARICGIEHASGDWIAFVDGDDLLKPEMYAVLIDNAVQYDADISHCGYEMVFPDHVDRYYGTGKLVVQDNNRGLSDLLSGDYVEPGLWNKLYKRGIVLEALEECRPVQNIRNMEDLLWNYYFFKRAERSVYVDECYYQYILRSGSAATSTLNRHKVLDPYRVFSKIEKDVSDKPELLEITRRRKASALIGIAAIDDESELWAEKSSKKARRIIRKNMISYLGSNFSPGLKLKLFLAGISPRLYRGSYIAYAKLIGTDHNYDINREE